MKRLCVLVAVLLGLGACGQVAKPEEITPQAYRPILEAVREFNQYFRQGNFDEYSTRMKTIGLTEPYTDLEYAIVDINKDGIPELALGYGEDTIHSLFTLNDGKPVHLISFWSRSRGHLAADGTIYNDGSGGAAYAIIRSYKLEPDARELTLLSEYQSGLVDDSYDLGIPYFYVVVGDDERLITEEEFDMINETYSNPPNLMKLDFIPIEQGDIP